MERVRKQAQTPRSSEKYVRAHPPLQRNEAFPVKPEGNGPILGGAVTCSEGFVICFFKISPCLLGQHGSCSIWIMELNAL